MAKITKNPKGLVKENFCDGFIVCLNPILTKFMQVSTSRCFQNTGQNQPLCILHAWRVHQTFGLEAKHGHFNSTEITFGHIFYTPGKQNSHLKCKNVNFRFWPKSPKIQRGLVKENFCDGFIVCLNIILTKFMQVSTSKCLKNTGQNQPHCILHDLWVQQTFGLISETVWL